MKKLLSILCLGGFMLMSAFSFAQTIVLEEHFTNVPGDTTSTNTWGYAKSSVIPDTTYDNVFDVAGWTGEKIYGALRAVKLSTTSAAGWLQTPALDLSAGEFFVSFKATAWKTTDSTRIKVIVVNGTQETEYFADNLRSNAVFGWSDHTLVLSGGTANTKIKFAGVNAKNSRFFLDDIVISTLDGAAFIVTGNTTFSNVLPNEEVSTSITINGYQLTESNYTISVEAPFSISPASFTAAELENGAQATLTFLPTAAGEYNTTFTINDGTTTFTAGSVTGTCVDIPSVATIAELRALFDLSVDERVVGTDVYKYTGEAIVTSEQRNSGYHYATIQDETGAIMVFNEFGDFFNNLAQGSKITNLYATLTNYYQTAELVTIKQDCEIVTPFVEDAEIEALYIDVELADFRDWDLMEASQSKLFRLSDVQYLTGGTFMKDKKYVVTDGNTADSVVYCFYSNAPYYGMPVVTNKNLTIKGFCHMYSKANKPKHYTMVPITYDGAVAINDNALNQQVNVYPNPMSDHLFIDGVAANRVEMYNILGNKVLSEENPGNVIATNNLSNGLYIVKIYTNEGVAVKKIVKE